MRLLVAFTLLRRRPIGRATMLLVSLPLTQSSPCSHAISIGRCACGRWCSTSFPKLWSPCYPCSTRTCWCVAAIAHQTCYVHARSMELLRGNGSWCRRPLRVCRRGTCYRCWSRSCTGATRTGRRTTTCSCAPGLWGGASGAVSCRNAVLRCGAATGALLPHRRSCGSDSPSCSSRLGAAVLLSGPRAYRPCRRLLLLVA